MDVGINTDSKEHSQVEETDSSCNWWCMLNLSVYPNRGNVADSW